MNSTFLTGKKYLIKDVIHDSIEITPIAKRIIDNPIFQRLRNLHQTGVNYLVFPNTNHTRFEHSLGTYHLAGLVLENLIKNSPPESINRCLVEIKFIRDYLLNQFELDDNESNILYLENYNKNLLDDYLVELIKIAGLVHDLGHGPFSHLFDSWIHTLSETQTQIKESKLIDHESRSVILFENIVSNFISNESISEVNSWDDENDKNTEFISQEAIEFISELINPNSNTCKNFIFQIISNSVNGLDVDKLDYLYRDSYYFGSGTPYDLSGVISQIQVIDKNVCFSEKKSYEIYKIFRSRYDMHKQFYNNKTTICIEYMIRDIMENLDPILKISEIIINEDIIKFIELDDNIILNTSNILKNIVPVYSMWKQQMDNILKISNRISNRNLYQCIFEDSYSINEEITDESLIIKLNENEQTNYQISDPNICIVKIKIGLLGGNNPHPLNSVYFYDQNNKSILLNKTKISNLISPSHQEKICYIIQKN